MQIKSMLKIVSLALLLGFGLATQAEQTAAPAADPKIAKAQQMIDDADKARKKAASVESEWRDTGKMIKMAKEALKKGDSVKAMQLAAKAHKQGVLGYQQAMAQKDQGTPSYLKY
ncbi:MAG: SoxXA-binding protein [Gammaproteobacteria bacterium]|nr:SoxXA-binding protein [Gammaproteobacteria bacterium]